MLPLADRRRDDRIHIHIECSLYPEGLGEVPATVKDVSEVGIAFELDFEESLYNKIKRGMYISFSYMDEFTYMREKKEYILNYDCTVARKCRQGEKFLIGCVVPADATFKEYVTCRKVAKFLETLPKYASRNKAGDSSG